MPSLNEILAKRKNCPTSGTAGSEMGENKQTETHQHPTNQESLLIYSVVIIILFMKAHLLGLAFSQGSA